MYYSEDIVSVPVGMIEGKCEVTAKDDLPNSNPPVVVEHAFYCEHLYDPGTGALEQVRMILPNLILCSYHLFLYFLRGCSSHLVDKLLHIVD